MLHRKKLNFEAADLTDIAGRDIPAESFALMPPLRILNPPFGKASGLHLIDALVRICERMNNDGPSGENKRLHAAGMIGMAVGNDDIGHIGKFETGLRELAWQLKSTTGVDQ